MNKEDILNALDTLAAAHDIDPYVFGEALAQSLRDAVIRQLESDDAYIRLDLDTGSLELYAIAGSDEVEVTLESLGRRGAAAIKEAFERTVGQVNADRLRELLEDKSGALVRGRITQATPNAAVVMLEDGVEGELLTSNAPGVRLRPGQSVAAVLTGEVETSGGTLRARLSRRVPGFVEQLMEEAVPSVADGTISIASLAREPGARTKVVLTSERSDVDPVALVIGTRGNTIRRITDEMYPERLDVISEGPLEEQIPASLSPAKILKIERVSDDEVRVWVTPEERAAAFGRSGVNVRLASQLLGVRIEIASPGSDQTEEDLPEAFGETDSAA